MQTRFLPVYQTPTPPNPEVEGIELDLGGLKIEGFYPHDEEWGRIWFHALDGWWERPATTGESTQRVLAHGAWNSRAFYAARVIEITGVIEAPKCSNAEGRRALRRGMEALNTAIPLDTPGPLIVSEDGFTRYCMVRQAGKPDFTWAQGNLLAVEWNIQLVAADYRKLAGRGPDDGWQYVGPVNLASVTGGMSFPMTFPYRYTGRTTEDWIELPNSGGNADSDVILIFNGPVVQPGYAINDDPIGQWFDLSLRSTDVLTVNLNTHAVELNGSPRRGSVRGLWANPKAGDQIHFTAGEYNQNAQMSVQYKEAWL